MIGATVNELQKTCRATLSGLVILPLPVDFSAAPMAVAAAGFNEAVIVALPPTGTETEEGESTIVAPS